LHIALDLANQRVDTLKFLLRPEIQDEAQFEIFSINIPIEIEQVHFENAIRSAAAHCGPTTEVHNARVNNAVELRFGKINAVRWKLLAVGAQVCGWKSDFLSHIIAMHNGSQDGVFAAKHGRSFLEIAFFDRATNCCTTYNFSINSHRRDSYDVEAGLRTEFLKQLKISASISSK